MAPSKALDLDEMLDALAATELAIAGYYAACTTVGGVFGILCAELQEDEVRHASYLHTLQRKAKERPSVFRPGEPFPEQAIQSFTRRVREGTQRVMRREMTRVEMLAFGLDLEHGLLESRPWQVLRSADPQITRLLDQLEEETSVHAERLQEQLDRARAA